METWKHGDMDMQDAWMHGCMDALKDLKKNCKNTNCKYFNKI
jgi:hypothetical protein